MLRLSLIFLFLLFISFPTTTLLAEEPEVAGAFGDIDPIFLTKLPCPSAMNIALPTKRLNEAIRVGESGKISSISFDLKFQKAEKDKDQGVCSYTVNVKDLTVSTWDVGVKEFKTEVIKAKGGADDKGAVVVGIARAYRKVDIAGEQVIGLEVPLLSNFKLAFSEVSIESIYKVENVVRDKDGKITDVSFSIKKNKGKPNELVRLVAIAKANKSYFIPSPEEKVDPIFFDEGYGELTLVVTLTE